jgi:hypothetical protein
MGYISHHAIIVTNWDEAEAKQAREKAITIFSEDQVSPIMQSPINAYHTFFIGPDGSKEGWHDSELGNDQRKVFTDWLKKSNADWIEVNYGDESGYQGVVSASNFVNKT